MTKSSEVVRQDSDGERRSTCVVIPAYNEELLIGRCIASVVAAGIPPEDVYVVDDCSTDATSARVRTFSGVNLLRNDRQTGKLGGLQRIITQFDLLERYQFLALLDADSHVSAEYFRAVHERFSIAPDVVLVCGAPHSEPYNWLTSFRALEYAISLRAYRKGQDRLGVITVAPGCASTYRTRIIGALDWDGQTIVEDMDLTVQIHRKRLGRIAHAPNAVAHTQDPRTIREYVGQITRWYSGTWQVMRLHRLPFGHQRIDAEFGLLMAEGLVYSILGALLPVLMWFWPGAVLRGLVVDQALWFLFSSACAVQLRRPDIVLCFPTYLFIRLVNCVVLLRTFWLEVIRARRQTRWFSVSRYAEPALEPPAQEVAHA